MLEGIAARSADIDAIWIYDNGWPIWRGGPMFYGDQVGVRYIRDQLAHYTAVSGDTSLQPAAYLNRLADEGCDFASLADPEKKFA